MQNAPRVSSNFPSGRRAASTVLRAAGLSALLLTAHTALQGGVTVPFLLFSLFPISFFVSALLWLCGVSAAMLGVLLVPLMWRQKTSFWPLWIASWAYGAGYAAVRLPGAHILDFFRMVVPHYTHIRIEGSLAEAITIGLILAAIGAVAAGFFQVRSDAVDP